jgi:hypothetical protein
MSIPGMGDGDHPMSTMSLQAFIAGRRLSLDLASDVHDYPQGAHAEHGYIYPGELVIEQVLEHWPLADDSTQWCLTLGNQQSVSTDLYELERALFEYAKGAEILPELTQEQRAHSDASAISEKTTFAYVYLLHDGSHYASSTHPSMMSGRVVASYCQGKPRR